MEITGILNSKSVKGFIKGSLVIIGLFIILYCGIAMLALNFGDRHEINKKIENIKTDNDNNENNKNNEIGKNLENKVFVLIFVLTILPIIVFFGFLSFAKSLYKKLFGLSGNKYDGFIHKMYNIKEIIELFNILTQCKKSNSENKGKTLQNIEEIIEVCHMVAQNIKSVLNNNEETLQKLVKDELERHSKKSIEEKPNSGGDSCNKNN